MISCDVIQDLLPLYADGLTSRASSQLVEEHIQQCPQCRTLVERMCAPMEPEPVDEVQAFLDAIHAREKKKKRRVVTACVLTAVICLISYWLYMEAHFSQEASVTVSTDPEQILAEMPALALSQAEKELADGIMAIPVIRQATDGDNIPLDQIQDDIAPVLPEDAEYITVSVTGRAVYIDFRQDNIRVILQYVDRDGTGSADEIYKGIESAPSPDAGGAPQAIYSLEYTFALDQTLYKKEVSKHVWFSFLYM